MKPFCGRKSRREDVFMNLCLFLRPGAPSQQEPAVMVKQRFPLGQMWDPSLSRERSRIITDEGAVIRLMKDGSTEVNVFPHIEQTNTPAASSLVQSGLRVPHKVTRVPQVLFANGSVSVSPDSGPVWVPDSEVKQELNSQEENTKRGQSVAP